MTKHFEIGLGISPKLAVFMALPPEWSSADKKKAAAIALSSDNPYKICDTLWREGMRKNEDFEDVLFARFLRDFVVSVRYGTIIEL